MTRLPPLSPRAALRWAVVAREVRRIAPSTILEIGCGQGSFGARLALVADYVAVEPDQESYQAAAQRIQGRGRVLLGDDTAVPAGRQWDLVCAFEVLEHLADDDAALTRWQQLVNPGGHLLLSVPAGSDSMGSWDHHVGHYRRYDPEPLAAQLARHGFQEVCVRLYGWPLDHLLEAVRNRLADRRTARGGGSAPARTPEDRTRYSGRTLQPRTSLGHVLVLGVAPFLLLQRLVPGRGTGIVVVARRPSGATAPPGAGAAPKRTPGAG